MKDIPLHMTKFIKKILREQEEGDVPEPYKEENNKPESHQEERKKKKREMKKRKT